MSILLACPSCQARLNIPETAVGKRVKCPKCQNVLQVPAVAEVPDSPVIPAPPKSAPQTSAPVDDDERLIQKRKPRREDNEDDDQLPRTKTKSRRVEDEDEDDEDDRPVSKKKSRRNEDDEDDDRPRKKKKKATASSNALNPVLLIIGGLAVMFFLSVAGGLAVYFFLFSDSSPVAATGQVSPPPGGFPPDGNGQLPLEPGQVPQNWQKFDVPGTTMTVYSPCELTLTELPGAAPKQTKLYQGLFKGRVYQVVIEEPVIPLPPGDPPPEALDQIARNATMMTGNPQKGNPVKLGNKDAREVQFHSRGAEFVMRICVVQGKVIALSVGFVDGFANLNDPDVKRFFDLVKGG